MNLNDVNLEFTDEDKNLLKELGQMAQEKGMDEFVEIFYSTIQAEGTNTMVDEHIEEIQDLLKQALSGFFFQLSVEGANHAVRELVQLLVSLGVNYETINAAYFRMYAYLIQLPALEKKHLAALVKAWYQWLTVTFESFYEELEQSKALVEEISTPIALIWDNIISVPIVGHMDSQRFMFTEESLLEAVERYSAKFVIIDVAGMDYLDSDVASHFIKMIQAINLMGTSVIMVGVGSAISRAFVRLDVDISSLSLRTFATFKQGLTYAFSQLNVVTN